MLHDSKVCPRVISVNSRPQYHEVPSNGFTETQDLLELFREYRNRRTLFKYISRLNLSQFFSHSGIVLKLSKFFFQNCKPKMVQIFIV